MADERRRSIGWLTYLAAALDAVFLWSMTYVVWLVRWSYEGRIKEAPPLAQAFMGIPATLWIVSGFLLAGAIIWKSKRLPREVASLIDHLSIIVLGILVGLAVIALFGPLT